MKNPINDGGPAFPCPLPHSDSGMTLRDYFAAKAMQSLIFRNGSALFETHCEPPVVRYYHSNLAADAYVMADAMLAARGKAVSA